MNDSIRKIIIRNFKKIPYFFEQKPKYYIEQNNYALIGKLSTSLLHDILTPLTSLSLSADIEEKINTQNLKPIIKHSTDQIQEYVKIMRDFLTETKSSSPIHINSEITKCITLLMHKAITHNIQIQYIEFDQIYSQIHPLHVYQIIINLLSNAIEASDISKTKKIILIIKKEKDTCIIECKDFGTGMSKETLSKIGTCNFSTKSIHRGFGLYSVQHILTDILNGELRIQSEPNNGSLFSCTLPIIK
jgi:signal transduction histidine kinase